MLNAWRNGRTFFWHPWNGTRELLVEPSSCYVAIGDKRDPR